METINSIIETTLNSFDFSYCVIVNIITYIVNKVIIELRHGKNIGIWMKRVVLLLSIAFTGVVYYLTNNDIKLIINSAILAPVSWSWVFKPIMAKLGIDYSKYER